MKHVAISSVRTGTVQNVLPFASGSGDPPPPSAYQIALRQLASLQAQASRLASAIEAAAGEALEQAEDGPVATIDQVRAIQQARLDRQRFFPPQLFADPAWDMLLELYAGQLGELEISVAELCIASNAPATVALECLASLEQQQLVDRRPDPLDPRRFSLVLSDRALRGFADYFASAPRGGLI